MIKNKGILTFLIVIYFTINLLFLLTSPPIWPDEAEYADVAYTILDKGQFYSALDPGLSPDNKIIYWYPPLMFYFFAGLFKVFGFSPLVLRLSGVIFGGIFIIILYALISRLIKNKVLSLIPIFLLISDLMFMRSARIARPEIFIMTFTLTALFFLIKFKIWWSVLVSGLLIGFSLLFQPFGGAIGLSFILVFLFFKDKKLLQLIKTILLFGLPIILFFFWWFKIINFNFIYLIKNMELHSLRKAMEQTYFQQIQSDKNLWYQSLLIMFFIGSVFLIFYSFYQRKNKQLLFTGVLGIILWLFIYVGKQYWYFAYITPLLYVYYFLAIDNLYFNNKNKIIGSVMTLFVFITFVINVRFNLQIFSTSYDNNSYKIFASAVTKKIPDGSAVLISAIPDPYFELKKNKTLRLKHFIGWPNMKKNYIQALNESDYVVYTGLLDFVYGNFLDEYLRKNVLSTIAIDNGRGNYQAFIYKLKPYAERQY